MCGKAQPDGRSATEVIEMPVLSLVVDQTTKVHVQCNLSINYILLQ